LAIFLLYKDKSGLNRNTLPFLAFEWMIDDLFFKDDFLSLWLLPNLDALSEYFPLFWPIPDF
jgi:hypothetical protein